MIGANVLNNNRLGVFLNLAQYLYLIKLNLWN